MDNLLEHILSEGIFKCKECGIEVDSTKWSDTLDLETKQLCHNCNFWMDYVEEADDPNSVRINGNHYWVGNEEDFKDKGMRGFDGKLFVIKFKDGRVVRTTNLWYQGQIPERFEDRLPDNATFGSIKE